MPCNVSVTDAQMNQEAAATGKSAEPKKRKKSKVTAAPAASKVPGKSQSPAKKETKRRKHKQENQPLSALGLDTSDAPWANEAVPDAEGMGQPDPSNGAKLPKLKAKSQHNKKSTGSDQKGQAMSTNKALSLLGFVKGKHSK